MTGLTDLNQINEEKVHECSAAYLNRAILLFHLRQKNAALKIVMEIFKYLDNLDDEIVQRLGLLTVHLLLDTKQLKKAEAVLELFQKKLGLDKNALSIIADDDNEIIREKCITTEDFRKMFKLCFLRTNLLNCRIVVIPIIEEVSYTLINFPEPI